MYHDLGFEVVGISLDTKKSALEVYVKKEKIPWANLYQDGAGWKHPIINRQRAGYSKTVM